MQRLDIKIRDPKTGAEEMQKVTVIRMWSDGDTQLWHHSNGVYGDKSGRPIRDESRLDVIEDPRQYRRAKRWWDTVGQKMAADTYGGESEENKTTAEEDAFYIAYPADAEPEELPPGQDWVSLGFLKRPDWWGKAKKIEMGEKVYLLEAEEDQVEPEPAKPKKKEPAKEAVNF